MHLDELMTDDAVLAELGRRLERHRLERNLTQADMADEAGIGRATLQRLERGKSVQMTSMIKVLRTIGLLAALDAAVPESIDLPIAQLEREQRRTRRRARARGPRRSPLAESPEEPWMWGEERGAGA
jgi:transcriptional regulator with XRE-family HTH domain